MIKTGLLALAALAISSTPAMANTTREKDKPASERVVCKTQRAAGSRLQGERVCKTKQEWDREKAESKRRMGELIEDRSSTVNTGG